jgi:hypothetical protein
MKKILAKALAMAFFGSLLMVGSASAATILSGSGTLTSISPIDDWYFTVAPHLAGPIEISVGSTNGGDMEINLFQDDGSLDLADFLENDDDDGPYLDSYILRDLAAGDYLVRVGLFNFGDDGGTLPIIIGDDYNYYGDPVDYNIDVSPTPEPATMLLFGTGIAGLAGLSRRKKNNSV